MKTIRTVFYALLFCPILCFAQSESLSTDSEEAAILAVITEQTRAYFERDFDAWVNSHVQAEYYREYKYWDGWQEKVRTVNGWNTVLEAKKSRFDPSKPKNIWNSAKYERSDINIRISASGDMAWVTYQQAARNPDTKELVGASYETRVMEKHDGQWKIAYLGYHYLPKEEN